MPCVSPPDMTSPATEGLTTEGFVNKHNAVHLFNRSHRSLSRDITTAVRMGDEEILKHFRLQTQDGQVREGIGVTIEVLDELRDAGQVPTWWAERDYLHQRYGLRGEEPQPSSEKNAATSSDSASQNSSRQRPTDTLSNFDTLALPTDPELRATVLEHLHYNDQQHARDTKEMMDRILQLVETNQQLQSQTNTLFNQFQETLKEGGGLRNLIAGTTASQPAPASKPAQPEKPANVVDVVSASGSKKSQSTHKKSVKKKGTPSKKSPSTKKPQPSGHRFGNEMSVIYSALILLVNPPRFALPPETPTATNNCPAGACSSC